MGLFGFKKEKKTVENTSPIEQQAAITPKEQQMTPVKEEKKETMFFLNTPGDIPVFWDNGNIYYIYKDRPIGTYRTIGPEDDDTNVYAVYDRFGEEIGQISWESFGLKATGSLYYWLEKERKYYNKPTKTDIVTAKMFSDKLHSASTFRNEKLKMDWKIYASYDGILDENDVIMEYGSLSPAGELRVPGYYPGKDYVGMMAAYICWNYIDFSAPAHPTLFI